MCKSSIKSKVKRQKEKLACDFLLFTFSLLHVLHSSHSFVMYLPPKGTPNVGKRRTPMPPATSTLPAGWSQIIDEAQRRLDHAIALADARLKKVSGTFSDELADFHGPDSGPEKVPDTFFRREEIAKWSERLLRLSAYLDSAEQVVHSVDEILHKEETLLRQHLAR